MLLLANVLYLLLAAPASARLTPATVSASTVPFDVNKVVARASGSHLNEAAPPPFDTVEFILDTTASGYKTKASRVPAVAFNGEKYLVVWTDDSLRGIIVPPSGVPDDPDGFKIAAVSGVDPGVSACGQDFLVVWHQGYVDVYGARVSGTGVVRDPNGFVISNARGSQYCPSVGSNGNCYLVAWHDTRRGNWFDIYAARVTPERTVLDTQGLVLATGSSLLHKQMYPDIASDGTDFLVAWESNLHGGWDIACARVSESGSVLDSGGVTLTKEGENAKSAAVSFDGADYLVVWRRGQDALGDIAGKRVTPGGTILDRDPIVISSATGPQESPDVAFDDSNYVVTWQDGRGGANDIYCARVTPAASVLDPEGLPVVAASSDQETPALAFGPTDYLVTWLDRRNSQSKPHVYGTRLDRAGNVIGPDVVIPYPESLSYYCGQNYPAATFDGTNYFVVWQDSQPGSTWDIKGARVTPTGEVLDVPPICISRDTDYQWSPAVAFGGSEYFVTWQDRRFGTSSGWTIYGARVTTSGTLLDTGGILVQRRHGYNVVTPSVAFDGTNFLVLWNQGWTYARFINQAGQFLDSTPFPVNSTSREKKEPVVVHGSGCYLVAWSDYEGGGYYQIGTMRVSRYGERLDPADLFISNYNMLRASVTCDSENFLVVWQDGGNRTILAGRVAGRGGILPPESYPVCSGPAGMAYPSATFDGENYIIAWQDNRNGNQDIYGAKVNRSLTARDTFPICAKPKDQTQPAIVHGHGSQMLAAFAGVVDSVGGNPASGQRIWGKLLSVPGPAAPAPLWPPSSYVFRASPVWVMVDTTRTDIDTYDFQVRYEAGGETLFRQTTSVPRCTIPDSVLVNGGTHIWQCRGHAQNGWSRFCDERRFDVDFQPVSVRDSASSAPRAALSVSSVRTRKERTFPLGVSGISQRALLELIDALGRRVRRFSITRDGAVVWDLKDEAGVRVGSGSYFARLCCGQQVVVRKFLLTD